MIANALLALAGILLVLWGVWLIFPPLVPILAGLVVLGSALFREVPDDDATR